MPLFYFHYPITFPVSLILLLLAARPLRIPLFGPVLTPFCSDMGETGVDAMGEGGIMMAFFLAARMMSPYVTGV